MTTLKACHNDPAIKAKYLARLTAHVKADELIHGKGWENGKGCAVGCTLDKYDHAAYETELGLPEWLARLEDVIFEGLPQKDAPQFAVDFLSAPQVGANLERVQFKFCAFLMRENIERVLLLQIGEELRTQVVHAIQGVLVLHEEAAKTGTFAYSAVSAAGAANAAGAAGASYSAVSAAGAAGASYSAVSAAGAAGASASADSATYSAAWAAARAAAWAAAWSARAAEAAWASARAASAARAAHYEVMAEKLIALLKETA